MRERAHGKMPRIVISALGTAVLTGGFVLWLGRWEHKAIELIPAIASLLLFWLVCFRFVPCWLEEWSAPARKSPEPVGEEPRWMGIRIFTAVLLFDAALLLAVCLLRGLLVKWDGVGIWIDLDSAHYLDIARDGYLSEGSIDRLVQLVFLPGYPLAVRALSLLTGNELISGFIISAFSFAGAAVLAYRLFRLDFEHSTALRSVEFLCLLPGAFFFAAPMSESLFLLLCLAALYLARKGEWIPAGLCGAYAAFTRSLGLSLLVPLVFAAVEDAKREKSAAEGSLRRSGHIRRLAGLLTVPLGFALYLLVNYLVAGDAFKFLEYQREHWDQQLDWFFSTAAYLCDDARIFIGRGKVGFLLGLSVPNLMALFGSLILLAITVKKLPAAYTGWFIVYFAVAFGATWLLSGPRYLAVLPTLWLSVARLTEKRALHLAAALISAALSLAYMVAFVLQMQVW